ncbi:hypothetical protein NC651_016975 [Populus alba x Populus x berolinensis]|nr:hypothetical protein NC651_016975 [Populus alba x Populus x berolinensis]
MAIPLLHLSSPFLLSSPTQKRFIYHHHHNYKNTLPKIPSSSFRNGSSNTPRETECPVPYDQQPINEYQNLSTSFPFSWASGDIVEYCSRLFVTGASFALLIALPVAWFGTVGPKTEPLKPVLAALSSGIVVVSLAVVRMYLGWAYVGNRLLSATVEYEETGWYDGQKDGAMKIEDCDYLRNCVRAGLRPWQCLCCKGRKVSCDEHWIWVKTAEVLARDRLLGSFSVKPVLSRLKYTLVTLAATLFVCVVLFINIEGGREGSYTPFEEAGGRAIPGVYNDDSARSFEPDAFCGEPAPPES